MKKYGFKFRGNKKYVNQDKINEVFRKFPLMTQQLDGIEYAYV